MSAVFIGNDVVDLASPRTQGRASDARFLARVFDADEQEAIRSTKGSDLELWSRWAAKEAGYKSISKSIGAQPSFVHRAFKVDWSETTHPEGDTSGAFAEGTIVRAGIVRNADRVAKVSVRLGAGAVHAVAVCTPASNGPDNVEILERVQRLADPESCWSGSLEQLMRRLSEREADAVRSLESAAVRLGARQDVARLLGVTEERVEIVCSPGPATRRPPRVLVDGSSAPADLSLSHDGAWIAWAIWVDR